MLQIKIEPAIYKIATLLVAYESYSANNSDSINIDMNTIIKDVIKTCGFHMEDIDHRASHGADKMPLSESEIQQLDQWYVYALKHGILKSPIGPFNPDRHKFLDVFQFKHVIV